MKNNNTIIETLDKFKTVPLEYTVLLYMVSKELTLTKSEECRRLRNASNNYLIIESLILLLNDFEYVEDLDDIKSVSTVMQSLNIYITAVILCNQDNIGLENDDFNNNLTVLLFNLANFRIKGMYPSPEYSKKEQYKKTFASIQDFLYLIKTKDGRFEKYINEYKDALEEYSQRVEFGLDDDEDCYYDDEITEDEEYDDD